MVDVADFRNRLRLWSQSFAYYSSALLLSVLGISFLSPSVSAQITHLGAYPSDQYWKYWYHKPDGTELDGELVRSGLIEFRYREFSWLEAEDAGLWINPELVVNGRFHIEMIVFYDYAIDCRAGTYESTITDTMAFMSIDQMLTDTQNVSGTLDLAQTYNATRDLPFVLGGRGDLIGNIEQGKFAMDWPSGMLAHLYCR